MRQIFQAGWDYVRRKCLDPWGLAVLGPLGVTVLLNAIVRPMMAERLGAR
ncbi:MULTISPECIES: hypothetical protein [unclassified Brevundimonas]|nr:MULTISPECIES: hypothetical protein [unclassified Brevundimonas]